MVGPLILETTFLIDLEREALAYRMTLVTANHAGFERVPGLEVMRY